MMLRNFYLLLLSIAVLLGGCASLPDNSSRTASYALTDTADTELGRFVAEEQERHQGQNGFLLLGGGLDAFVARAVLAELAERSIDVQYYLYHRDQVGWLFTGFLVAAADRGVRVRILVDDMDMGGRDAGIIALDNHPNIEIRLFNPFDRDIARGVQLVTGLGTATRRMHNKSFTVDNQMTIVGGRNIGNEYFDADPTLEFADLDVLVIGDVVKKVSVSFDEYWNSELAYPAKTLISERPTEEEMQARYDELNIFMEEQVTSNYMTALLNSDFSNQIRGDRVEYHWGDVSVVVDHPDKISSSRDATELHLMTQLAPYFEAIENELIIFSPYFVPGKEGVEFFKSLTDKGVHVKILTNSLASNDVALVHAGYSKYREDLLRAGVELYEMNKTLTRKQRKEKKGVSGSSKASLHAKSFVLDRKKVFIGSLNLDPRSFYENSEIGVVIESENIASMMAEGFDENIRNTAFKLELKSEKYGVDEEVYESIIWHGIEDGEPVTYDVDPHTGFWRRFGVGFMGIMPIESQL